MTVSTLVASVYRSPRRARPPLAALAALAALSILTGNASAAPAGRTTTYRCDVDGRTLYSDVPCALGKQSTLATDDAVSASERAAADARLRNDKAALADIERQRARQRQEDLRLAARDRRPDRETTKHAQACLKLSHRARDAHDQFDLASPRDQPKARLKMQRADEDYAALCKH